MAVRRCKRERREGGKCNDLVRKCHDGPSAIANGRGQGTGGRSDAKATRLGWAGLETEARLNEVDHEIHQLRLPATRTPVSRARSLRMHRPAANNPALRPELEPAEETTLAPTNPRAINNHQPSQHQPRRLISPNHAGSSKSRVGSNLILPIAIANTVHGPDLISYRRPRNNNLEVACRA